MDDWDRRAYGSRRYYEQEEDKREKGARFRRKTVTVTLILLALIFTAGIFAAVFWILPNYQAPEVETNIEPIIIEETGEQAEDENMQAVSVSENSVVSENAIEEEDPQESLATGEEGAASDFSTLKVSDSAAENETVTYGIDVAKYQGTIDWQAVAASGVQFAMIRLGYRTQATGKLVEDVNARYNLQQASANGIKLGAYFFSTAVTEMEAMEEAEFVLDLIAPYPITYPVAYNCEGYSEPDSRQYGLDKEKRTKIAGAFLNRIYLQGYTPMFYSSKRELEGDAMWLTSSLEKEYKIWVAWYPGTELSGDLALDYSGKAAMWQYTNKGTVPGIPKDVDIDIAYFGYDEAAEALSDEPVEEAQADVEALLNFRETDEEVTAKEATNLRELPSQEETVKILYTLQNGETAKRTGISDSGWSRLVYNGQTCYAVSSFLTTDLSYRVSEPAESLEVPLDNNGIRTVFTPVSDLVTPKIEINLRTLPSVTNPESLVVATVPNGTVLARTGVNTDYGWSRVEFNGVTLYCVSSYLTSAQ